MELLQLRYFQTVAQMESITRAAKYHNIPQPSMSQTIQKLEHELGDVQLFDRRNGHIFLNARGRRFLEYVNRALSELDTGVSEIPGAPEIISGPVRIKILENHRFILTGIPQFAALYPDVSFITSHGFFEDRDSEYDLCVSSKTSYRGMLHAEPLIREEIVLAVHEQHPFAAKKSVSLEDLRGEKIISLPAETALYAIISDGCRNCGFTPNIPIICDDPYFIRKYVSENMGVAPAPAVSWKGRFRENTVLVPFKEPLCVTSFLLWDERRYMPSAVRAFRDYLLTEAKNIPGNLNA